MKYQVHLYFFLLLSLVTSTLRISGQNLNKDELIFNNAITIIDKTVFFSNNKTTIEQGKKKLYKSIKAAGGTITTIQHWTQSSRKVNLIVGTLENTVVRRLVSDNPEIINNKSEGVFYQWKETPNKGLALIIGGTDSKGLFYALSELAEQIKDKGLIALTQLKNTVEFPDNKVRGVDKFITDERDDSWFFSEEYWQYYISQLAINRFNRLTLITGYNDGKNEDFMIPVYPYLFQVPGFEEIKLKNNYKKTPTEYLIQLRRIGDICHSYGLEFVFGIWGHGMSHELIDGLPNNTEAFTSYCSNGMKELLKKVPEIDGIQLRVNYESGIGGFGETAENFWKEIIKAIGDSNIEQKGKLFLDIRAKGLTVKMREWVLENGINLSVTSKYSWEGVGLPYHPTEMRKSELAMLDNIDKRQRYGYADFLNNSRDFDFIYRLWGLGTIRMFTWADPDYVKRFSYTTSFGGSKGFQVTPPLTRKENSWNLFQDKSNEYFKWEDERYWSWYLLFGRLGYSKNCSDQVWKRAFKEHYGHSYQAVLDAYSHAGKVLPLITSSHLTYHPANYNWAEIESGGALFSENNANSFYVSKGRTYQSTEPGDPGLFYCIEEYVKDVLNKEIKPKINPVQLANLFEKNSKETLKALSKVKLTDIPEFFKKEYRTNELDLKITAALAAYHSNKIKASTDFVFFQETKNSGYLLSCLEKMKTARKNWQNIVDLTQLIYHTRPMFLHDNGTWKDRLTEIDKDIIKLKDIIGKQKNNPILSFTQQLNEDYSFVSNKFKAIIPEFFDPNNDLKVSLLTGIVLENEQSPKVHFRIADMTAGKFIEQPMLWNGNNYSANIPAKYLNPQYDLLVYFTTISKNGHVVMHPGILNEENLAPYFVVKLAKTH
ncbi:hypothetical protein [Siansivirga zeaxanthinifaciens]|uniref:Alpha glucuronidase N-terminal domain-containing protein n=1 Tax=Siansivirga zeaxanthinifaciens CC-SAMT-1 TaxID=1454006 RepID=A0A0C5WIH6_9FLAO|nr:hypothetical protein [Siansivirga zeaxanthinifaciens]AJR04969.1 hypothetical protein AW14_13330 [Siansivirga zeaxanthinifaciens CC-SAMT-1]